MAAKYQAYLEYKDSGVEWIGSIPNSWEVRPLYALSDNECIKNESGSETNVLSLSYGNIIQRDVDDNYGLLPESFNTYQLVNSGDIILRLTDLQNDKRSLRVGQAKEKGIITSAYLKLTAKNKYLNARYFYRLLHSYDTTKVFYGMGGGLRQSMKFEDMRRLPLLVPNLIEQEKIANFLDHETAKIDMLIEKQQQLITLLKEKRQAVISHAVTKGLNPQVTMKASGVEWLGEVPEHWEISPIKYHFKNLDYRRIPLSAEERGNRQGQYRYYGASGVIDHIDNYIFDEEVILVGEDGANLVNRSTPLAFTASGRYWVNNHAHILKASDKNLDFWAEVIENIDVTPLVSGSAQPKLTAENLYSLKIAFPKVIEDRTEIQDFINTQKTKYENLITKAQQQIEFLQERRTALISAAVTGKIDVRNWTNEYSK